MKRIISIYNVATPIDIAILIARVAIGLLMLVHGVPKLEKLLADEPVQFASVFGMSPAMSLAMAVFAEVFCSVLLILGIASRIVVIPLIITMLVAVFSIHINDPFVKQEMGLHYLLTYVVILLTGSGRYSFDAFMSRKKIVR